MIDYFSLAKHLLGYEDKPMSYDNWKTTERQIDPAEDPCDCTRLRLCPFHAVEERDLDIADAAIEQAIAEYEAEMDEELGPEEPSDD